jgi:hypothetical protein
MRDINKLDAWYKENLQQEDTINQMREYWEKQKPELLIRAVGGEMMAKLKEKTDRLHSLEKEWQDVYFELISKEEEIRTEEKELKKELSEFIELCKKKLKQKNK